MDWPDISATPADSGDGGCSPLASGQRRAIRRALREAPVEPLDADAMIAAVSTVDRERVAETLTGAWSTGNRRD